MPLLINLRHLEPKDVTLEGEMAPEDLELEDVDELVHAASPLQYSLTAQKIDQNILVQGKLELALQCECARCLKPFSDLLKFDPWVCHLPLEGPEKVSVISDCVDLTPYIREDILLGFPQHPLCETDCGGLKKREANNATGANQTKKTSSAWAELDKLKF